MCVHTMVKCMAQVKHRQTGACPSLYDKEVSALLHNPNLASLIDTNPLKTINPHQNIAAAYELLYVTSRSRTHEPTPQHQLAHIHAQTGKLRENMTLKCLQILYHGVEELQPKHPGLLCIVTQASRKQ